MKKIIYTTGKVCKHGVKMSAKIFFPWIYHYMTDRYANKHHHVVVDTIFSLIIIILILLNISLGYWFYLVRVPADVELQITVPEYVISGHEFDIKVDYFNPNKNVDDVEVKLDYPQGFNYESASIPPKEGTDNIYNLGDLSKNTQGEFEIKGRYYGDVNTRDNIIASIQYNFFNNFSKDAFFANFVVADSTLETEIEMPEKILDNEEFEITIKYKNSSPLAQEDIKLNLDIPAGLIIDNKEIDVGTLQAWEEGEVKMAAHFDKIFGEVNNIIRVGSSVGAGGISYAQGTIVREIDVLTPRVDISTTINNSGNSVANFDDNINFSATVRNIGDAPLKNIVVTGNLEGSPGSYNYFNTGGGSVNGNQITWIIPHLDPGQTATVGVNAQIGSGINIQNFSMGFNASATAQVDGFDITTYTPQSASSAVAFNSRLNFIAEAQYYGPEGEQLGYGPYPLEAGNVTALRVFWKIQNFTNNLKNLTVQTTLPTQVEWTGRFAVSDGTAMAYDPASRTVTWHVNNLEAFQHPQGSNFEVRVSPNWQQIGQNIFTNMILTRYEGAVRTKDPISEEK